jgi:hypothetical protein
MILLRNRHARIAFIFSLSALYGCSSSSPSEQPASANQTVAPPSQSSCAQAEAKCLSSLSMPTNGALEFYQSHDLHTANAEITKLVISIHGVGRNFGSAFTEMTKVYADPSAAQSTLILAPHFLAAEDSIPPGYLYWDTHGWPSGDDSLDSQHLSSYEVLDALILQIVRSGNFPNLEKVLITGLSAGGQFTERYAAGNLVAAQLPAIHFRYLIASPSSYLYFDANRFVPGNDYQFQIPASTTCAYNDYRYGLLGLNRYLSLKSPAQIADDFGSREIVLMVGDQDDATVVPNPPIAHDPKDGADLDVSCAAEMQGASRLERAKIFKAYLDQRFPAQNHPLLIGGGIAHQLKLYEMPELQPWLSFTK